jgi:hypothetical protein
VKKDGESVEGTNVAPKCDANEDEAQLKERNLLVYKYGA